MRIGIITVHSSINYGAMLQALATQEILIILGHSPQFIDLYTKEQEKINNNKVIQYTPKGILIYIYLLFNRKYKRRLKRFRDFKQKFNLTKRFYSAEELYANVPDFDIYIAGSDQIWNLEYELSKVSFLEFVQDNNSKKISYASSFGTKEIPAKYKDQLQTVLNKFDAISVREDDAVKIVEELVDKKIEHVLDPTFLYGRNRWEKLIENHKKLNFDYILIYALNNTDESVELLNALRKKYNLKVVGIPMGVKVPAKYNVDMEIMDAGPIEFVSLFKHATVVCTSSFHGLAFSVIFEKTFYAAPHQTRNSRINSLLKLLKFEERQYFTSEKINKLNDSELFLDYKDASIILETEKTKSINFLKENTN